MSGYTLEQIAGIIGGTPAATDSSGQIAGGPVASIDTRTLEPGAIFFALPGERTDGHRFLTQAFDRGASIAVVAGESLKKIDESVPRDRIVITRDPGEALRALATHHRNQFDPFVVIITGSNGKTTTKELVAAIAREAVTCLASPGNLNNLLGVPLTLLRMNDSHEWLILELGISEPGEMKTLGRMVRPHAAIITNANTAHGEGLGTIEQIAREKLEIASHLQGDRLLLVNGDDRHLLEEVRRRHLICRTFGLSSANDYQPEAIEPWRREGLRVMFTGGRAYAVPLYGVHQSRNLLAALALAEERGLSEAVVSAGLDRFSPPPGRFQPLQEGGVWIVDDTYNANPASAIGAVQFLKNWEVGRRRALFLGDMLELGADEVEGHRRVGAEIAEQNLSRVFLWGDLVKHVAEGAIDAGYDPERISLATGKRLAFSEEVSHWLEPEDVLVIKGSRGMCMELFVQSIRASLTEAPTAGGK